LFISLHQGVLCVVIVATQWTLHVCRSQMAMTLTDKSSLEDRSKVSRKRKKTGILVTSMEEDLYDEFVSVEKEKKRKELPIRSKFSYLRISTKLAPWADTAFNFKSRNPGASVERPYISMPIHCEIC